MTAAVHVIEVFTSCGAVKLDVSVTPVARGAVGAGGGGAVVAAVDAMAKYQLVAREDLSSERAVVQGWSKRLDQELALPAGLKK